MEILSSVICNANYVPFQHPLSLLHIRHSLGPRCHPCPYGTDNENPWEIRWKAAGSALSTTPFKVFWSALQADSECVFWENPEKNRDKVYKKRTPKPPDNS